MGALSVLLAPKDKGEAIEGGPIYLFVEMALRTLLCQLLPGEELSGGAHAGAQAPTGERAREVSWSPWVSTHTTDDEESPFAIPGRIHLAMSLGRHHCCCLWLEK